MTGESRASTWKTGTWFSATPRSKDGRVGLPKRGAPAGRRRPQAICPWNGAAWTPRPPPAGQTAVATGVTAPAGGRDTFGLSGPPHCVRAAVATNGALATIIRPGFSYTPIGPELTPGAVSVRQPVWLLAALAALVVWLGMGLARGFRPGLWRVFGQQRRRRQPGAASAAFAPFPGGASGSLSGPPTRPLDPSRPASWPGAPVPSASGQATATNVGPALGEATPCEGGQQLGRVGSEIILSGELMGGTTICWSRRSIASFPPRPSRRSASSLSRRSGTPWPTWRPTATIRNR